MKINLEHALRAGCRSLALSVVFTAAAAVSVAASGPMELTPPPITTTPAYTTTTPAYTTPTTYTPTINYTYSNIPSSWAGEVYSAVATGHVPVSLQNNYQQSITRVEFCQLISYYYMDTHLGTPGAPIATLDRLASEPETYAYLGLAMPYGNVFTDTSNIHVRLAYSAGIVSGYADGKFKPNGSITREQAAVMLANATVGVHVNQTQEAVSYSDSRSFSPWANTSILFVSGITTYDTDIPVMTGTGKRFNPKGNLTREQAIIAVHRLRNATVPNSI